MVAIYASSGSQLNQKPISLACQAGLSYCIMATRYREAVLSDRQLALAKLDDWLHIWANTATEDRLCAPRYYTSA
jgi:hypothetical protein